MFCFNRSFAINISFHINFDGRCAEALQFYQNNLAGVIGSMLSYRDSPASVSVPDDWQDKIIHGSIVIDNFELVGTDTMPDQYQQPSGFCLLIRVACQEKVKTLVEVFQNGGEIILPPQKTFWSPCYAIVNDRFGVPWKFNCVT